MEEINHFSHTNHQLKLINSEAIVGASLEAGGGGDEKTKVIVCYACKKHISSGFIYGCIQCCHFLHKACAQVPPTINHPSLYHHPLKLYDFGLRPSRSWSCSVCRSKRKFGGFCYFFTQLKYNINFIACIACCLVIIARKAEVDAMKEEAKLKVEHEGHPQHSLTLQLRPAAFHCDACGVKDEGLFYQCDSCDFWMHKTCATLAPTLDLPHDHPNHSLVLVYSLPEKFFNFEYYCEFCDVYIERNVWLYHCANCRYFAHIKCALNAKQHSTPRDGPSSFVDHEDTNDLLHFPMLEMFTDPLKLIHFEKIATHDNERVEINHWSHDHPLILNVVNQGNTSGLDCSDLIEVCQGCVRPLSLPYYKCKDGCSFIIHKYCAELPVKLDHQLHPDHSLDLINTYGHKDYYKCFGCYSFGNTFLYKCGTCKFYLDVNCAFLPNTIKHKSHKHPLTQFIGHQHVCNACNKWYYSTNYACKPCDFILNMHCAMRMPQNLAHRYCKGHEIPLTYPPVVDHAEDFYCDICEKIMHPKLPLYHCHKCRNSFHLDCINRIDSHANIFIKDTKTVSYHKHPLTFVRRKKTPKYVCSNCNCDINGYLVLECRARVCNFNICYTCHYDKVMPSIVM